MNSSVDLKTRFSAGIPYIALLLCYLLFRLIFRFIPEAKLAFIYPSGVLVQSFFTSGSYHVDEWQFLFGETLFILGESCSGTTFFSMLIAYVIYSMFRGDSWLWLLAVYPVTLIANTIRVISSIYAHNLATISGVAGFDEYIHIICGVSAFLVSFIIMVYLMDYFKRDHAHAAC